VKTVELSKANPTVKQLLKWARTENILLKMEDGETFVVAALDDFEAEVESLRHSEEFMAFLDARAKERSIPIDEARKKLLERD
jgi:hypothetical protein